MKIDSEYLVNELIKRKVTVAVAESCTGGQVSAVFTAVPGASEIFKCGLVTYSNEAKQRVLGISEGVLTTHGAVSKIVAEQMATSVRGIGDADIGLSVTGIAGPGGGCVQKPVGTVYLGLSTKTGVKVVKAHFKGSRACIQAMSVETLLKMLKETISK
jgi:PncC family amidohydrolase